MWLTYECDYIQLILFATMWQDYHVNFAEPPTILSLEFSISTYLYRIVKWNNVPASQAYALMDPTSNFWDKREG